MAGRAGASKSSLERSGKTPSKKDLKEQKKRRKAVEEQRDLRRRKADKIYVKYAGSPNKPLNESQVKDFVAHVLEIDPINVEPHALQLVIDTAKQSSNDTVIPKEPLIDAIERYGEYISKSKQIDKIWKHFDKDGNGTLDRNEFRLALDSYEKNQKRECEGMTGAVRLFITESDLDFILKTADKDGDGNISRNEILPALAAWEELAAIKVEKSQECPCVIL